MIRMLKSTRDSAVKSRTQAVNQMKALVVTAPSELRGTLDGLAANVLAARCRSFRPGRLNNPTAAAKYALRSLAYRYRQLSDEVRDLEAELERLSRSVAPALVNTFGVGPNTAASLLIAAGSNPDRAPVRGCLRIAVRSQSNTCFIRQDEPASAQPRWRPPGQCGALSHSRRQAASRAAHPGIYASSNRGGNEQARRHPLSQTLCCSRSLLGHPEAQPDTRCGRLTCIGASLR